MMLACPVTRCKHVRLGATFTGELSVVVMRVRSATRSSHVCCLGTVR